MGKKVDFTHNWGVVIRFMLIECGKRFRMLACDVADDRFLIEWLGVKGKEQRQHWAWNKEHEEIMRHAYFYYYTSAFAKPCYREALAKIPHVFQVRSPGM
jgi:PhoD related phosphatase